MATKFTTTVIHPKPINPSKHISPLQSFKVSSQRNNGTADTQDTSSIPGTLPSARSQLDLLDQLTSARPTTEYGSDSEETMWRGSTIREQLVVLGGGRDGDFSVPLGKNLKKFSAKYLTTSQKRNIKRQSYLNEVSQRNDSVFFATIGAFVMLPPFVILGIAVATGYVQLFP